MLPSLSPRSASACKKKARASHQNPPRGHAMYLKGISQSCRQPLRVRLRSSHDGRLPVLRFFRQSLKHGRLLREFD
jgi:hypothetical protein